jgi:hypothetical protein
LSDDSSNEEQLNPRQKHEPHPPSTPISEDSRHHRRRRHQQLSEQTQESSQHVLSPSKSMDLSILHSKNELDSPQISFHRKNIFQSLKLQKNKVPLPRPSNVDAAEHIDEKQRRKNRRITNGSLRPARVNIFILLTPEINSKDID